MLFPWFVFEKEGCVENGSYTQLMCHEMLCLEVKKWMKYPSQTLSFDSAAHPILCTSMYLETRK